MVAVLGACDVGLSGLPRHTWGDGGDLDGGGEGDLDGGGEGELDAGGEAPDGAMCVPPAPDSPRGTCANEVTPCGVTSRSNSFQDAVRPIIDACGIKCGGWRVTFTGGCVTEVIAGINSYGTGTEADRQACLENALLNARFDCVPCDGRQDLYLSCTIG